MICILARDKKPEYYQKLFHVLEVGLNELKRINGNCKIPCEFCRDKALCNDIEKAMYFIQAEHLRAELKEK